MNTTLMNTVTVSLTASPSFAVRLPTRILAQIFCQYSNRRNTVRKVANILRKVHLLSTEVQHVGMQKSSQFLTYCPKFLNGLVILQQKCWNFHLLLFVVYSLCTVVSHYIDNIIDWLTQLWSNAHEVKCGQVAKSGQEELKKKGLVSMVLWIIPGCDGLWCQLEIQSK